MSHSLKSKTLSGLFWSFFERMGQQGIQFIISIILARLFLPEQFSLIAMLLILMAVVQAFLDSRSGGSSNSEAQCYANIHMFELLLQHLVGFATQLSCAWSLYGSGLFQNLIVIVLCVEDYTPNKDGRKS